jgi:hypothetical protein
MTALELWTWISIGVLIVGSSAVFAWFLRDVLRMGRRKP